MRHPSLAREPSNLIAGRWLATPGERVVSRDPSRPSEIVHATAAPREHVDAAVAGARRALPAWSRLPIERRAAVLRRYARIAAERADAIARLVTDEVGKVRWEARQEAALLAGKVDITLDDSPSGAMHRISPFTLPLSASREGRCFFRPHGVVAVVGPFNFPVHLANGHIVPALLAGDTVVLKPSDKAPACGQALVELFAEALEEEGLGAAGAGVVNLVQGGADVASALVAHDDVDAIAFTGSWAVGRRILEANLDRPGRIVALEMGGNNAAIVLPDADLRQAAVEIVRCAFNTSGQRCTSTRRLLVHEQVAPRLLRAIARATERIVIGDPRAEEGVFSGPLVSAGARAALLDFQRDALAAGAEALVPARALDLPGGGFYASPGVLRVERFVAREDGSPGADVEVFGPLLRVATVRSLDEAIDQANATRFGLAASIFTRDDAAIDRFLHEGRAGCLNVNTGTAGMSGKLPFGGLGLSGNHRPAGAFALDYCAHPVASMVERGSASTLAPGMGFDDAWLA
jgi:succinylglutamic semialdehyde dehydrogenase